MQNLHHQIQHIHLSPQESFRAVPPPGQHIFSLHCDSKLASAHFGIWKRNCHDPTHLCPCCHGHQRCVRRQVRTTRTHIPILTSLVHDAHLSHAATDAELCPTRKSTHRNATYYPGLCSPECRIFCPIPVLTAASDGKFRPMEWRKVCVGDVIEVRWAISPLYIYT